MSHLILLVCDWSVNNISRIHKFAKYENPNLVGNAIEL